MSKLGRYEVHPFADAFPLLKGRDFDELVDDIRRRGLREPIVLTHDERVLVDGPNRYRACQEAGVEVRTRTTSADLDDGQIGDLIVSANLKRRHLTPGQRSLLGLKIMNLYAKQPKHKGDRPRKGEEKPPADMREVSRHDRESAARAAKAVGVSGRIIQEAKKVQEAAPDLVPKVKAGRMSVTAAYKQAHAREKQANALERGSLPTHLPSEPRAHGSSVRRLVSGASDALRRANQKLQNSPPLTDEDRDLTLAKLDRVIGLAQAIQAGLHSGEIATDEALAAFLKDDEADA